MNEDMLFCRAIKRMATTKNSSKSSPEANWTDCMIHRESLAMEELCPELSEMMDTVIRTVNYINTRPAKSRIFCRIMHRNGAQYQSLLFHCNSRCMSRGNAEAHAYNLREVPLLLHEENLVHAK
jgi:hypothetical protein